MSEKIEKNSPTLGRSSVYTKTSFISRLPQYLTVGFVRFFWKAEQRVKAKIMRVSICLSPIGSYVIYIGCQIPARPGHDRVLHKTAGREAATWKGSLEEAS